MPIVPGKCFWCGIGEPISEVRLGCVNCNIKHMLDFSFTLLGDYLGEE